MNELSYPVAAADRAGLAGVLLAHYPVAYRLAAGLCGPAADAVARRVLDRAAALAPRWASDTQAERWFVRYTVLTAREAAAGGDVAGADVAGADVAGADVAVLAWLAPLTRQQREAMVLHHGLGLDLHRMAAAMDCSTRAAATHLVAAVGRLRDAGPLEEWTAGLPAALAAVVPPAVTVAADVDRVVRRRWRWAWARRLLVGAVAAAVAYGGWRLWQVLVV